MVRVHLIAESEEQSQTDNWGCRAWKAVKGCERRISIAGIGTGQNLIKLSIQCGGDRLDSP